MSAPSSPVSFPEELPISACVREIAQAIHDHQVVIVAGETGSGKTTQLPKICLAMGRGLSAQIGVTQPRRIATTSVAARVASELGVELGREVGYQIRFQKKAGPGTYLKFMTDGVLLAEIQSDPLLRAYDTLIIDEAHERSLNIDFLLGYLKRLLSKRPDLRVIVSSATLETDRFARHFNGAPVVQVSGRTFPVETFYRPDAEDADLADRVATAVLEIDELDRRGDILVFLPGEREIHEALSALTQLALPFTEILPLYGRLTQAEQARVFTPASGRRVVLATNVAETSLTIQGIVYVVDAGLARINRYQPRTGVTQLLIEPISRASAEQRKGRAGRVESGVCIRLYEEKDFETRPAYTDPEILRVGLAGAILQMKSLGLGDIREFPFLDPPPKRAVDEGQRVLEELGAIDEEGALTEIGKRLARLPVDPRVGRMILGGEQEGALREALIIASALGIQDPRERPRELSQKADQAHRRHTDEGSDFLGLIKLWRFYQLETRTMSQGQQRRLCKSSFLSYVRMREWADVHHQLASIARELGVKANEGQASDEAVHRAILPGLLSRLGMWHPDSRTYIGARQTRFVLHPSSALARRKTPPPWVVVAELAQTSQLYGRTVAEIDPTWLERAGGRLCKRSYGEPFFTAKTAQVMAKEQVTLFGLPIVSARSVHLGPIDPKASRRLFLIHALVRGEYEPKPTPPYAAHNRGVFDTVRALRARARKSDMIADDDAVALFFEQRVPEGVYSGKTFEAWRAAAEAVDPKLLFLSLEDVLLGEAAELSPGRFPDTLRIGKAELPLAYRFDPGEEDDGVTMTVPLAVLPQLDPAALEWIIPGWNIEKVSLLLYGLPKSVQRELGSIKELAELCVSSCEPLRSPLLASIERVVHEVTGVRLAPNALRPSELPPHLSFNFRVVEGLERRGKDAILGEGRDLVALMDRFGVRAKHAFSALPKARHEAKGLTAFPPAGLPETTQLDGLTAFPALVEGEHGVDLRLCESREVADRETRGGLRRLAMIALGTSLAALEKQVPARVASSALHEAKPRRQLALRALDEALGLSLDDASSYPRTAAAFDRRVADAKSRLPVALAELGKLAHDVAVELDLAHAALKGLYGKPGALPASLEDVKSQLEHLAPRDLLERAPRPRLRAMVAYLRAIRVRLDRLPNGPQKDKSKAESVLPFWRDWLVHHQALIARGVPREDVEAFRYLIEEYRVAVFAPEIGSPLSLSQKRLAEAWQALVRR